MQKKYSPLYAGNIFFMIESRFRLTICQLLLLLAFHLAHERVESKIEGHLEVFALVLYKIRMPRDINLYLRYLVLYLVRHIIQLQVHICTYYLIMKGFQLLYFCV